jgi:hypothetical protein
VFSVQIIFYTDEYDGTLQVNYESRELNFFYKTELPSNLNPHQGPFILDWLNGVETPVLK